MSTQKVLCTVCKTVELTKEEMLHKRCYWCTKQLADSIGEGAKVKPEAFGRTAQERDSVTQSTTSKTSDSDFSPSAKEFLKKEFKMDVDKPQVVTIIEAHGLQGTRLTLELTAPLDEQWYRELKKQLGIDLAGYIQLVTLGVKHQSIIERIVRAGQSSPGHENSY